MFKAKHTDERRQQFTELAMPELNGLYNLARNLTKRPADAEDLVQDAYVRAFEHFDRFQPGTNFRAWIYRILRNTFINQYHKNKAKLHVDLETVEPTLASGGTIDALDARIEEKVRENTTAVLALAKKHNQMPTEAALTLAKQRVAEAMAYRRT